MKWGLASIVALSVACGESREAPVFERYIESQPSYILFGGQYQVKYIPFTQSVQCLDPVGSSYTYVAQGQPLDSCSGDEDKVRELPSWVLDSMVSLSRQQSLLRYTIDSIRYEELRRLGGAEE
jgi:hypothetical protein